MKWIKAALPHLTIALAIALLVLGILNEYNPRMGFLEGRPALALIGLTCVCAIASAAVLYALYRQEK